MIVLEGITFFCKGLKKGSMFDNICSSCKSARRSLQSSPTGHSSYSYAVHVGLGALSSPGLPGRLNKSCLTDSRTLTSSFTNGETHKEADSRMDVFSGRMAAMVAINQGK